MSMIIPKWSAPSFVKACTFAHPTQTHVHAKNHPKAFQACIQQKFEFQKPAIILEQIHSNICIDVDDSSERRGDALITKKPHQTLLIQTADCLPILICHRYQPQIANIHAGWRGLDLGIIENTFAKLPDSPKDYIAWIGPAICKDCYEVGLEFKEQFLQHHPELNEHFHQKKHWHFDLAGAAETLLKNLGVSEIVQSQTCTFENTNLFSYRRQKEHASRLATMIWLETKNDH